MHQAAYNFITEQVAALREMHDLSKFRVIEVGSYNVNGSVRPLLKDVKRYIGIDARPGPDVDYVARVQNVTSDFGEVADLVLSCEALEHDPDQQAHVLAAYYLLRLHGWLLISAAGPARPPHGSDGGAVQEGEAYANVDPAQLYSWLVNAGAKRVQVYTSDSKDDVYAIAQRGAIV
jgi:hypothetical protein